eukprot:9210436-Alexandrium_andersonii.AAC.1
MGCLLLDPVRLLILGLASRAWEGLRNAQILNWRLLLRRCFELLVTPPLSGQASTHNLMLIVLN